jgi:glyoxylase-like metal-dependent hydrolase (beta-lactamase superfamily II)
MPNCIKRSGSSKVKIIALEKSAMVYSCDSYLILGDWNRIEDLNTVIDPGNDDFILGEIERASTGFGKTPVEQIILTHNHFDHASGAKYLKERYHCRVFAFSEGPGVDELLKDGQFIKAGDDLLEVIHTPGHSHDSICLYAAAQKAIFSGDTQLSVIMPGGSYPLQYQAATQSLGDREIQKIYSGHDGLMPRAKK